MMDGMNYGYGLIVVLAILVIVIGIYAKLRKRIK